MASPSGEVPSHRACQHCRSQKVRCLPDESNPDICQRCAKSGRPCVFTPLQKRKQRKRTDTRVAELEREMRAMRQAFKHKDDGTRSSSPADHSPRGRPVGLWYKDQAPDAPRLNSNSDWENGDRDSPAPNIPDNHFTARPTSVPSPWQQQRYAENAQTQSKDVIDTGLVTIAQARQLLDSYRNDLFPHFPIVPISPSVTVEDLRMRHPALFLAILAAAAGKENPDLSAALDQEVLQTYAQRTVINSEKSLEMVQALLISSVWYNPPSKFGQLKYYEYIHMAATMAMDIGIGTRPAMHRSRYPSRSSPAVAIVRSVEEVNDLAINTDAARISSLDTTNIVSRRTFLACYIICAGVSVSLRRPHMLRVTSYLRECVDVLDQSPNAVPTDRMIIAWTKLMMIAEEISSAFCYDDPGGIASITELRTQLMLKDFESRLSSWYRDVPESDLGTGSLLIMYYTMRLYLHEIALHVDHSPEDFRAPYQMGYIYSFPDEDEIPSQILAAAIAECISCSFSLLNTFNGMEPHGLRGLPVFSFVRVSFAAFVLAKLCLSATHRSSRIGRVLDRSTLKVESVLHRTIIHAQNVVGTHPCRVPAIFLALLFRLRQWCLNPEMLEQSDEGMSQAQRPVSSDTLQKGAMTTKSVEGPTTIPTVSSSGSSPGQNSTGMTPISQPDRSMSYEAYAPRAFRGNAPNGIDFNGVTTAAPIPNNYAYANDSMEIDNNLIQILGGLNAFSEGGLTGLDDWGPIPADFMGMNQMDATNWQYQPGMNYDSRAI